jgi:hypothetical protein
LTRNSLESLLRSLSKQDFLPNLGQDLKFSGLKNSKFAAKFAEAGNWKLRQVSRFLDSQLLAAGLLRNFFHSIFRSL